jgi:hypothetical protein
MTNQPMSEDKGGFLRGRCGDPLARVDKHD